MSNTDITTGALAAYDTDQVHGLVFTTYAGDDRVQLELNHDDSAFALCAFIDRYGLDNVRRAIDRIAQDDPDGQRVGLSAPSKILQGVDPRKAG